MAVGLIQLGGLSVIMGIDRKSLSCSSAADVDRRVSVAGGDCAVRRSRIDRRKNRNAAVLDLLVIHRAATGIVFVWGCHDFWARR